MPFDSSCSPPPSTTVDLPLQDRVLASVAVISRCSCRALCNNYAGLLGPIRECYPSTSLLCREAIVGGYIGARSPVPLLLDGVAPAFRKKIFQQETRRSFTRPRLVLRDNGARIAKPTDAGHSYGTKAFQSFGRLLVSRKAVLASIDEFNEGSL